MHRQKLTHSKATNPISNLGSSRTPLRSPPCTGYRPSPTSESPRTISVAFDTRTVLPSWFYEFALMQLYLDVRVIHAGSPVLGRASRVTQLYKVTTYRTINPNHFDLTRNNRQRNNLILDMLRRADSPVRSIG
jgi:hypothetical protein